MATPARIGAEERKEAAEDTIVLELLDAVDGNASFTQRDLAQELGIALGLANSYLKRCVRKGLLKVAEAPRRRYAYYVTPKGFAEKSRLTARYLAHSFDFLRRARDDFSEVFAEGVRTGKRRFVLVGGGDLADVAMLVAPRANVIIVAVVPAERDAAKLVAALSETFEIAVVTAAEYPQETYEAAIAAFGAERVRAPKLLRIKHSAGGGSTVHPAASIEAPERTSKVII